MKPLKVTVHDHTGATVAAGSLPARYVQSIGEVPVTIRADDPTDPRGVRYLQITLTPDES